MVEQLPGMSKAQTEVNCCQPYLRCDDRLWSDLTARMAAAGMNLLLIDLGDGVRYESHPEIAVANAWSPVAARQGVGPLAEAGPGADPQAQLLHRPRRLAGPLPPPDLDAGILQGLPAN